MNYKIRELKKSEYPILQDFLYEAIFIPDGMEPPPKTIIKNPDLWRHIDCFGELKDDYALAAEADRKIVGAVWVRTIDQYGYIDDKTPAFSISLYKEYRRHGIGTAMMKAMLIHLKGAGFKHASLSVQKKNYAIKMYLNVGFKIIDRNEEEYIMIYDF